MSKKTTILGYALLLCGSLLAVNDQFLVQPSNGNKHLTFKMLKKKYQFLAFKKKSDAVGVRRTSQDNDLEADFRAALQEIADQKQVAIAGLKIESADFFYTLWVCRASDPEKHLEDQNIQDIFVRLKKENFQVGETLNKMQ